MAGSCEALTWPLQDAGTAPAPRLNWRPPAAAAKQPSSRATAQQRHMKRWRDVRPAKKSQTHLPPTRIARMQLVGISLSLTALPEACVPPAGRRCSEKGGQGRRLLYKRSGLGSRPVNARTRLARLSTHDARQLAVEGVTRSRQWLLIRPPIRAQRTKRSWTKNKRSYAHLRLPPASCRMPCTAPPLAAQWSCSRGQRWIPTRWEWLEPGWRGPMRSGWQKTARMRMLSTMLADAQPNLTSSRRSCGWPTSGHDR